MRHLVKATLNDVYGITGYNSDLPEDKRREIAYHEAGHAVIAEVLTPGCVGMVSLCSEEGTSINGFMLKCQKPVRRAFEILIAVGGKAGYEMQFGKVASGTSSDLEDAIKHLACSIGSVGSAGVHLLEVPNIESQQLVANREQAIYCELQRYLFKAQEIIAENRPFLHAVANELLEKGTLLFSDMKRIRESCAITPAVVG